MAYLKKVTFTNHTCFRGEHTFTFVDENDEWCQWNVFLGNNNTGKTNLLRGIGAGIHVYYSDIVFKTSFVRLQLTGTTELVHYEYGVIRKMEKTLPFSGPYPKHGGLRNLGYDTELPGFEAWLFHVDYIANSPTATPENRKKAAAQRDLLIGILKSEIFTEIKDIRFMSDGKLTSDDAIYIQYQTKDGWCGLYQLGYGYQSMLAWLMDFAKRLFEAYPDSENPLKEPAVVLVDEIDLHLHPHWQRTIIKYLSGLFPRTQFIVTTHSPFVLQSMEHVNLYTLRREAEADHVIPTHHGVRSFVGWSIEELLSEIMEMEDDIRTERYQELSRRFHEAIQRNDPASAEQVYQEFRQILPPDSPKIEMMELKLLRVKHA
jgi:hypothetical protein